MRLAIFAATGGVGRHILEQAVAAGHDVTAVVRNPTSLSRPVPAVAADLTAPDPAALESAVAGADAVLSAGRVEHHEPAAEVSGSKAARPIAPPTPSSAIDTRHRLDLLTGVYVYAPGGRHSRRRAGRGVDETISRDSTGETMSTFTDAEIEYLNSQQLGRLATVGPDGRPHVTPLGVFYDPQNQMLVIGGHAGSDMAASKKFRDARRHPDVAVVVDDVASVDPWTPRYVEVRGYAETHLEGGEEVGERLGAPFPFDPAWLGIRPRRVLAYGIETPDELTARDVA